MVKKQEHPVALSEPGAFGKLPPVTLSIAPGGLFLIVVRGFDS
jgi:hypothetical protein